MPRYSACQALLWHSIAKDRKKRLLLHAALKTSVEVTAIAPSDMLDHASDSEQK